MVSTAKAQTDPDQSTCSGSVAYEAQSPRSLRDFMRTESGSAGLLVVASLVALVWANSPWSQSYVDLWHTGLSSGSAAAASRWTCTTGSTTA